MKISHKIFACSALATAQLYLYARYLEPSIINVRKYQTQASGYDFTSKIRIVHFTDTHIGKFVGLKKIKSLVKIINSQKPDIVLFTGDLLDSTDKISTSSSEVSKYLKRINAPLGKFAVTGNHEYRYDDLSLFKKIMRKSGFKLLQNETINIKNTCIKIIGIDDVTEGNGNILKSFENVTDKTYNMVLCHEPDMVDFFKNENANFAFSGHSHGGQVQLPFIGPIILSACAKKYPHGIYHISDDLTLHTSEGTGVTKLPFRFFTLPNIGVIDIDFF